MEDGETQSLIATQEIVYNKKTSKFLDYRLSLPADKWT